MKSLLNYLVLGSMLFAFASCNSSQKGITLVADDAQRKVDVMFDGQLFTSYLYPADLDKPVLYPIYTAKGAMITRGFPLDPRQGERVDHPHQVGAWFNFGDVNGLDFWNNSYAIPEARKPRYGSIRHQNIVQIQSGLKEGILVVAANWVDYTEKILLKEETTFKFSGSGDWRIIERTTTLTAYKDTVTFTDNKEGLIAIRMDRAFEEPNDRPSDFVDAQGEISRMNPNNEGVNGLYRNSEGRETEKEIWGKPAKWVSLSAEKAGEKITVAIVDHKDNWGHPARSMARGYGLFSTNNMGNRAYVPAELAEETPLFLKKLNPGESVVFRYQIVIKTNGFATDEDINQIFAEFNSK